MPGWALALTSALLVLLPVAGATAAGLTRDVWSPGCTGLGGAVSFVAVGATLCAASLLPTYAVAVAAGYLHGAVVGSLVAVGVVGLGAWLGHHIAARVLGASMVARLGSRAQILGGTVASSSVRMAATVVGLVRLAPVTPFALTNVLLAGARVALLPYLLGTLIGLAPRTALVATAGASMAELELGGGATSSEHWVLLGMLFVAVLGLSFAARRLRSRMVALAAGRSAGSSQALH
jgi:uncharacterized membrane protein YdjX (TVP38/TMEM64 family)